MPGNISQISSWTMDEVNARIALIYKKYTKE